MNPSKQISSLPEIPTSSISIPSLPTLPGITNILNGLINQAKSQASDWLSRNLQEGTTNAQEAIEYASKLETSLTSQAINAQGKAATMSELIFTAPPGGGPVTIIPVS